MKKNIIFIFLMASVSLFSQRFSAVLKNNNSIELVDNLTSETESIFETQKEVDLVQYYSEGANIGIIYKTRSMFYYSWYRFKNGYWRKLASTNSALEYSYISPEQISNDTAPLVPKAYFLESPSLLKLAFHNSDGNDDIFTYEFDEDSNLTINGELIGKTIFGSN